MGHCKDCHFWEPCEGLMICDHITYAEGINPAPNTAFMLVRADDDSGLDAWLVTGPEFGCVKFLAKKS